MGSTPISTPALVAARPWFGSDRNMSTTDRTCENSTHVGSNGTKRLDPGSFAGGLT